MNRAFFSVTLLACCFASAAAFAQDKESDAERLFKEGQQLMADRRFGEACPKFETAYRKDQQLGTLLNLAYCHKEQGAIWQSWLEFREAEVKAIELRRTDRRDFAQKRMAELERSLARVVIEPSSKAELVEVLVEDHRIPDAEKGATFAAEPGQRKLTFRAKGKKQAVQLVSITKGERVQRVPVPEMEDVPKEPVAVEPVAPPPEPAKARASTKPKDKDKERDGDGWSRQKKVALVLGGVGLLGIGVGSVFGIKTMFGHGCVDGPETPCTDTLRAESSDWGTVSTIGFIAGGGLVATAAVLWLTAPSASTTAAKSRVRILPSIGAGWAGLDGTF